MWVLYNNNGQVITNIPHGEVARQGSSITVYIAFEKEYFHNILGQQSLIYSRTEFIDAILSKITAQVQFDNFEPPVYVTPQLYKFKRIKDNESICSFEEGKTYVVYKFDGGSQYTADYGDHNLNLTFDFVENNEIVSSKTFGTIPIFLEKTYGGTVQDNVIPTEKYQLLLAKVQEMLTTKLNIEDEKVYRFKTFFTSELTFASECLEEYAKANIKLFYGTYQVGGVGTYDLLGLVQHNYRVLIVTGAGKILYSDGTSTYDVQMEKLKVSSSLEVDGNLTTQNATIRGNTTIRGNVDAINAEVKVATPNSTDTAEKAVNKQYADGILTTSQSYTNTKVEELNQTVTQKTSKSNLVSVIGQATETNDGLMSKDMFTTVRNMYRLLNEGDKSYVDTFNEILKVFEQYPVGTNLLQVLNDKLSVSDYEEHEQEYLNFKEDVETALEETQVTFVEDGTTTSIVQVLQHNSDYSFKAVNISTVSISIPSTATQGFVSGFSIKIGEKVPTIAFANGTSYPMLFTLNGAQRKARQLAFKPMQTLTGAVMCDGINVYVYLKEMQQEVFLS